MALLVKKQPANAGDKETWVRSLGKEDPWRRKWQSTPVFLPGESHGRGSVGGYSPEDCQDSDTTEATELT